MTSGARVARRRKDLELPPRQPWDRAWEAWSAPRMESAARVLTYAALATLFLHSAGTIDLVYTLRVPYLLALGAVVVGVPFVVGGWRRQPAAVRWAAVAVACTYVLADFAGAPVRLPGSERAGQFRDAIYLVDIAVGLGLAGLVAGLWNGRSVRPLLVALAGGAAMAAIYGVYQWPAQRYGLPLSDINNTLDSNGVTSGAYQGQGIFGWERVRGTFVEPHFLAKYLGMMLPLALGIALTERGRRRWAWIIGCAAVAVALLLTSSASSWVLAAVGWTAAVAVLAVALGRPTLAAATGAALATLVLVMPVIATAPGTLAGATGRGSAALSYTTEFRTQTWDRALKIWSRRPIVGYGPGQASVQLALLSRESRARLLSAQGLWAAALIDAGLLGFLAWLGFLGAVLVVLTSSVLRRLDWPAVHVLAALFVGVAGSMIAGDRLDLAVWALVGVALAAASGQRQSPRRHGHEQSRR